MTKSALKTESILFESSYQEQPVVGYVFTNPAVTPRAILQISHGMVEHILHYRNLAEFLTQRGFVVCGNDHLGHGATSGGVYQDGFFAPKDGRNYVLMDLLQMNRLVRAQYPGLPLVLLGHSMGSFFARWFIETYPKDADAAIFCGTSGKNLLSGPGMLFTQVISKIKGPTHVSKLVGGMAFGNFNKKIKNASNTSNNWLSGDEEYLKSFQEDPRCKFQFTVSAFHEMLTVLHHVNKRAWYTTVRKDMPIFVIAGKDDPVGKYGVGIAEVANGLKEAGVTDVTVGVYENMRHEILNERNSVVPQEVFDWSQRVLWNN